MSFTVVPLHNLTIPPGTVIPFGKFTIQDIPSFALNSQLLKDLSYPERILLNHSKHALVSEYEADTWGFPDPDWKGSEPKGIQELRWQSALLANLSMWMIMPSSVCVSVGFHFLTELNGQVMDPPLSGGPDRERTLYCHPRDLKNVVGTKDLVKAGQLFETLSTVPRKNSVWPALRAFWAALTTNPGDLRYPLYWQGLESLFGSDTDIWKVSMRLRNRISYFLAEDQKTQTELHDKVKDCYSERSAIVHGRWEDSDNFHTHMYTTEAIVRTVIRHIADKPGMLGTFLSPQRNEFLESWVKSKAFVPPMFP